ncbi:hypothetical protein E3P99_00951 [Wallemia hederae]|uniref:Hyaluronan/mRNA-binding protein domain-containing protein n=1 Tax=Wallemia hederae TaxID=1540922 RepID=A0A4V4LTV9_9BASI|nr:hypothetical protein E3P99_00951 [Wallemia hederae]
MTRTTHNDYPRAVACFLHYCSPFTSEKDRHESRNGLTNSTKKQGAGPHAWGSYDEEINHYALGVEDSQGAVNPRKESVDEESAAATDSALPNRRDSNVSVDERNKARKERKSFSSGRKSDSIDLAAIARSSAAGSTRPEQA